MAVTHKLIQTVTVSAVGGAASIDFTSIPQTYTDLKIVFSLRNAADAVVSTIQFNGLSTNLTSIWFIGSGSAASSSSSASVIQTYGTDALSYTASTFSNMEFYIPNYTKTTSKAVGAEYVVENNATAAYSGFTAGLWTSTAAINQVTLFVSSGNVAQYSSASLYGIKSS
jgi:hypothetical protein